MKRNFGMVLGLLGASAALAAEREVVYIGTYTSRGSEGIYRFVLDRAAGTLVPQGVTGGIKNPSFLAIHPTNAFLYAVSEVMTEGEGTTGGVTAFAIDPQTYELKMLNQQSSGGAGPCYVTVDRSGRVVLVANYGGGSVAALPVNESGKLEARTSFYQDTGSGPNRARQEKPHAHSINTSLDNRFAFAADLGTDKIMIYQLDYESSTIKPHDPPSASVPPGGGPRHFAFHPSGQFAYTNNELTSTVTAFTYDIDRGRLAPFQTISTLPESYDGSNNTTAEIKVHPNGKFLYVSNRGHNSIAKFKIDPSTGELTAMGYTPTMGATPRNFGINPEGDFLIAANQDSGTIVLFRLDGKTGDLTFANVVRPVPMPVCVKFVPITE